MGKTQVGLIGTGTISAIYLKNRTRFETFEVAACADIDMDRARARAEEYGVPRACTVAELLADPEIAVVINLTVPQAHATVALATVRAGKSVYNEKPLTLSREEGRQLLDEAKANGVRVGCAPDTFLGAGLQTCRQLIDDGVIGEPVAATAFMLSHGPEGWHPNPEFYYQVGGGPMFDMGPYYLTALINLLGPVRRVSGSARATLPDAPDRQPALQGADDHRQDADPHGGDARFRGRADRHADHQLRRLGQQHAPDRDLRQRRLTERAGPEPLRWPGARAPRRRGGVDRGPADAAVHRELAHPRRGRHGAGHPDPGGRTARAATWPTTCWTSCTRRWSRPSRGDI